MKTAEPGANALEASIPDGVAPWNRLFASSPVASSRLRYGKSRAGGAQQRARRRRRETPERSWGVFKKGGKLVAVASTIEGNVERRAREAFINGNKLTERKHYG